MLVPHLTHYVNVVLLQYRTARLLHTAALRLRKHSKRLGSFGAWNRCLNHLLTLAESHIESVILAKFSEAVDRYFPCSFHSVHDDFAHLAASLNCLLQRFCLASCGDTDYLHCFR